MVTQEERKQFRQRLQNLRTYREQNPGKGYIEWKQYQNGGQISIVRSTIQDYRPTVVDTTLQYKGPLYTDIYGRKHTAESVNNYYNNTSDEIDKFTGKPIVRGIDPVVNLRTATDFTPVGDITSAYDLYNAITDQDWSAAGLAALSLIPIIPSQINRVVKRPIPRVNRDYEQDLWRQKQIEVEQRNKLLTDTKNKVYGIVERLMEDPAYINRAEEVQKEFGDNYLTPYADIFTAYNLDPNDLPHIQQLDKDLRASATMGKSKDGVYTLGVNPVQRLPYDIEHEMSHYTDLVKSGTTNAEAGNNMFYQMSKDLTKRVDSKDRYFSNPSEQKAHMNQLREYLYQNGYLTSRDQKVTVREMNKILKDIKDNKGLAAVVRASKQFKSTKTYTKWFNKIPLLTTTTLLAPGAITMLQNSNSNNIEENKI